MIKIKMFTKIILPITIFLFCTPLFTSCNNSKEKPVKFNRPDSAATDTGHSETRIQMRRNNITGNGMMGRGMMRNRMMGMMQGSGNNSQKWNLPNSISQLKNPIKDIAAATKAGKKIFQTQCSACHGQDAEGDGPAGKMLNPKPANLISGSVQVQSDGALYWMITNGKPPMPAFKGILKSKQRWEIIEYLRSLKHD